MSRRLSVTDAEWDQLRRALMSYGGDWEVADESHDMGGEVGYEAYRSLCAKVGVRS